MIARLKALAALAVVLAGTALPATASAQRRYSRDYRSRIDTTMAFDKNGIVNVNAGNGDVIITGGTGNTLRVRATSDDDDIRLDVGRQDDRAAGHRVEQRP